jgi:hypothetical protein
MRWKWGIVDKGVNKVSFLGITLSHSWQGEGLSAKAGPYEGNIPRFVRNDL